VIEIIKPKPIFERITDLCGNHDRQSYYLALMLASFDDDSDDEEEVDEG
jgi:hypothetical protein